METKRPPIWIWRWTAGAIALVWLSKFAVSVVSSLADIIMIIVVSFLVACSFEAPVRALERRGLRRGGATGAVMLLRTLIGGAVVAVGGALMASQLRSLRTAGPELLGRAIGKLGSFGINVGNDRAGQDIFNSLTDSIESHAGSYLIHGGLLAAQIATAMLIVFYLVADGPRLRRNVCSALPQQRQQYVLEVWSETIDKAGGYIIVHGILAGVSFLVSWVYFAAIHIDYAFALAVWVGVVSQVIPAIGSYIAGALPLVVAAGNSTGMVVAVVGFLIVYQVFENYLLYPRIARRVMQVHPAVAFVAAVAGGILAGGVGAMIAVPIVATVQAVISSSIERHHLVESHLLEETERTPRKRRTRSKSVGGDE